MKLVLPILFNFQHHFEGQPVQAALRPHAACYIFKANFRQCETKASAIAFATAGQHCMGNGREWARIFTISQYVLTFISIFLCSAMPCGGILNI